MNNLQKELNALETTVANMQVGGAPLISGDLDMNSHAINELTSLQFATNHTVTTSGSNLTFDNNVVVTEDNIETYNNSMSSNLDMNGNYVVDAGKITFQGSNYPLMVDTSNNVLWNGDVIVTSDNITSYETNNSSANGNLDMNGNDILNMVSFQINDSATEGVKTNFVCYDGGLASVDNQDSLDARLYIQINETPGRPYFTDFRAHPITNVSQLSFTAGSGYSLFVDGTPQNRLIYAESQVVLTDTNYGTYITFPPGDGFVETADANLDMANFQINNAASLDFGNTAVLAVDGNDDLTYNTNVILRSDNWSSYVTDFNNSADGDLNMSHYQINNAASLDFGSGTVISTDPNYKLVYNQEMLVTRPQYLPTYVLATNESLTFADTSQTLPSITIPNDKINFDEGFRIDLNVPQYVFDTNDEYLISICVKLHTTQANQYTDGILFQVKSDAFTTTNLGSYSSLIGTFDFYPTTPVSGNVTINNMNSPVVSNPTDDYDVYVVVSAQTAGNDFSTSQFNLSLQTLSSNVYDNLDLGTFGLVLNESV
ncbi:MAG: hypothetical protein EBQ92_00760, partial [Proteobacteria bacterium]|nr:hypothetical protein [Pseudomonadota bacterium]